MKELSIEEKAKRYDEALKVLHKYDGANIMFTQDLKEEMFPELAESEDEKIKHEIKVILANTDLSQFALDYTFADMLAWLEKQSKQSSKNTNKECLKGIKRVQEYQDLSDWEKKFDNIASMYAHNKNQEGYNESWYVKERAAAMLYHAKKELEKQGEQKISFSLPTEGEFPYNNPADTLDGEIENIWKKLSCDNKFTATKDGFHEVVIHFVNWYEKQGEQKPAELGEDRSKELSLSLQIQAYLSTASYELYTKGKPLYSEKRLKDIHKCMLMWQKLHNTYFYQKLWSEEDEIMICCLHRCLEELSENTGWNYIYIDNEDIGINKLKDWLKSLKDRYTWKPSDEQMEAVKSTALDVAKFSSRSEQLRLENEPYYKALVSLYNDLKKLRGE